MISSARFFVGSTSTWAMFRGDSCALPGSLAPTFYAFSTRVIGKNPPPATGPRDATVPAGSNCPMRGVIEFRIETNSVA